MPFYTYIIHGLTTKKFYIGSCENLTKRLKRHNAGYTKSIKNKGPFQLTYVEKFQTRNEAYRRERQIKSYKGGNAFRKLIEKG